MITILLIGILAALKATAVISMPWIWVIAAPIALRTFFRLFSKDCEECI